MTDVIQRTALIGALVVAATCGFVMDSVAKEYVPQELRDIAVVERLGESIDQSLKFVDHTGKDVTLGDYFGDNVPVLLTLNYYRCAMLCNLQLNALVPAIKGNGLKPSHEYRIVTVSIDPREGPEAATGKRDTYLKALGMGRDVDWSFLTGTEDQIAQLAEQVGFKYSYDEKTDQYAHGAAVYFLSPKGTLTKYLYGLSYLARDVRFALLDAAEGTLGNSIDAFLLSCFYYDAELGSYVAEAWRVMRLGGVMIVLALTLFLGAMWRVELRRRATEVL